MRKMFLWAIPTIFIIAILIAFNNILNAFVFFFVAVMIYFVALVMALGYAPPVTRNEIICVDIETTGLKASTNEILQVSIMDGNYNVLFSSYIKPSYRKVWKDAEKVNHITPAMVENAPLLSDVKQQLISILSNAKLITGYNVDRFDMKFLERHLSTCFNNRTYDVMHAFDMIVGKEYNSLEKCCEYFNVRNEDAHNSLSDVRATLDCFYKVNAITKKIKIKD